MLRSLEGGWERRAVLAPPAQPLGPPTPPPGSPPPKGEMLLDLDLDEEKENELLLPSFSTLLGDLDHPGGSFT